MVGRGRRSAMGMGWAVGPVRAVRDGHGGGGLVAGSGEGGFQAIGIGVGGGGGVGGGRRTAS